jgi:hypothetical protein
MRQFRSLFRVETDADSGIMSIYGEKGTHDYPSMMVRREGEHVLMSSNYGPIELALRLPYDELAQTIARLNPVDGPITTRQVGSTEAYLSLGLRSDGSLLMRPTLASDARGHLTFNLSLPAEARQALCAWLHIEVPQETAS